MNPASEPTPEQAKRFRERLNLRQIEGRVERMLWVRCPEHGRSPRHPFADGCFWCVERNG